MTSSESGSFILGLLIGAVIMLGTLALAGRTPVQTQKQGYQQGVKDCMTGRAKVEIKADTLFTFP